MKTINNNETGKTFEVAKQILYSLQVLTAGLFIPFLFVFGISYNTPKNQPQKEININNPGHVNIDRITVDFNRALSDQNS